MAIRMRRGLESELDISKALPGEWLVSTDTRIVRMCVAPGIVLRMATYEAFEADTQKFIEQIEQILSETKTVQEAVERIQNEIENSVITVENYVESAKGYSNLSNTYAMQSKMYAEKSNNYADDSYNEAERAKMYAENASAVTDVQIATQDRAGLIKGGENHIAEDGTLTLTKQTTERTLYNSHNGGVVINRIAATVEQKQYSGKNLIPYPYNETTHTERGIEWTDVGNGEVIANGTNVSTYNSWMACATQNTLWLEAGAYILSGCPVGGSAGTYHMCITDNNDTNKIIVYDVGEGAVFTLENDCYVRAACRVASGATVTNIRFKPMVRKATIEDDTWEPYVGGTASPNVDYPQEIRNTELTEIKSANKNLIPYPYYETTHEQGGISFADNGDGTVIATGTSTGYGIFYCNGSSTPIELVAGTYALSGCYAGGGGTKWKLQVLKHVEDSDNAQIAFDAGNGTTFTITEPTSVICRIMIYPNYTLTNAVFKPQLELGEATEYEPYKKSTVSVAFTGRAVEVDANVDYTYEKDGKYYIADTIERVDNGYVSKQRILHLVFNGTENGWATNNTNQEGTNRLIYSNSIIPSYTDLNVKNWSKVLICSHMQQCLSSSTQPFNGVETIALHNNQHTLQLCSLKHQDVNTWKAFLAEQYANGTPFTVDVRLPQPIVTQLSDEEVTALLTLKSFDDVTHISANSKVQPIIDVEYGTSKVGGYTLDALNTAHRSEIKENANADRLTALEALTTEVTTETEES